MLIPHWWRALRDREAGTPVPQEQWRATIGAYPFLRALPEAAAELLRDLAARFLAAKRFHGAAGLAVTDAMALAIAAQACLPLLGWAARSGPRQALRWYDDFIGIVVHADEVLAPREATDDAGIVHRWKEAVVGEAMDRGPVMLSWTAVAGAAALADAGINVVIHEFAHKLDLRNGAADGCPPLPRGFLGARTAADARRRWSSTLTAAYADFRERCIVAERFGGAPTWLDAYGATSPVEFFAVACEGYFVNRQAFAAELPTLLPLFDAFFRPMAFAIE